VAVKITRSQSLEHEAEILRLCGPLRITPKIYDYFIQDMYHVIIMDIMDMTLSRYLTLYNAGDPTAPDLCKLAYKIVHKLHKLHNMGYVHGDLHPNNIMYRSQPKPDLYIIDLTPTHVSDINKDLDDLVNRMHLFPLDIAAEQYGYESDQYQEIELNVQAFVDCLQIAIKKIYGPSMVPQQQLRQQEQQQEL
jgi:tRNA A-37 threonylcarbamoyl transferase component Bud32